MKATLSKFRITRRNLLQTVPALCASALLPRSLFADATEAFPDKPAPAPPKPFSRLTDIALAAGLTKVMPYGTPEKVTYIVE